jgi:CelD/BcsL family acetyltransferase involved in cellulose biosynthesis
VINHKDSDQVRRRYRSAFERSKTASVFHSLEWLDVFRTMGFEAEFLEVDEGNFIPFLVKGKGALRRAFSLPLDTYGGPLFRPPPAVTFEGICRHLDAPTVRMVDFSRRMESSSVHAGLAVTHLLDLSRGYERVLRNYSKRNREALRQAERRGITVEILKDPALLRVFYVLYRNTVRRYQAPNIPFGIVEAIFEIMASRDMARFYLAWHEGRPVAANIILRGGGAASDWINGYREEYLSHRPNNALLDRAVRDEIESGTRIFNFGATPAGKPGILRFKEGFGATASPYTIFWKYTLAYEMARKMKQEEKRVWRLLMPAS